MYIRLLLYSMLIIHLCHSQTQASEIQIFEDKCSCYAEGNNEPIREIKTLWDKIRSDVFLKLTLTTTPNTDIPQKLRGEYKKRFDASFTPFKEVQKACFNQPQTSGYYYPSDCKMLFTNLNRYADLYKDWELFDRTFVHKHKLCNSYFWSERHVWSNQFDDDIRRIHNEVYKKCQQWNSKESEIFNLFQQVQKICLERHISLRTFYECGYLNLLQGDVEKALDIIQKLIDYSQKANTTKYLQADTFLNMGVVCTLSHDYEKAVHALSEGIKKHPKKKDLYVERAIAYFELGEFDKALEDYIASGKDQQVKPPKSGSKLKFAKGFLQGAASGTLAGAKEMPASLWYSAKGACNLLWATASHPIDTSEKVVDAVYETINYLKNEDLSKIGKKLVPEVRELLKKWDSWSASTRGKKAGFVLGKYGVDIIFAYGGVKAIERIQKLRHANALSNLKTMNRSQHSKDAVIAQTEKIAAARSQFYTKAHIHADKQGKHILGHKNYIEGKRKSIFTHPNGGQLLEKHAGKGHPENMKKFGEAGYKETVDFGTEIGYAVDMNSGKRTLTTRGKIHYDKNGGAHIVPIEPIE